MGISPTSIKHIPERAGDGAVGELAAAGEGSGAAEYGVFNQGRAIALTINQRSGTSGNRT